MASWQTQLQKLTEEQLSLFQETSKQDSQGGYEKELHNAIKGRVDNSKTAAVSAKIKPFFDFVNMIAPITSTASHFSPAPFSVVLGGITCILSMTARLDDYQDKLLDMLSALATELAVIYKYKSEGLFNDDPNVQASQIDVITDVLNFCTEAAKLFYDSKGKERSMLGLALKAQWKDFDGKFGGIKGDVHQHVEELEKWRNLANARRLRAVQEDIEGLADSVDQNHKERKRMDESKNAADNRVAQGK